MTLVAWGDHGGDDNGSDRDNDDDDGWKVWQKWGAQPGEQRLWLVLVKTGDQGTHGEVSEVQLSEKQYNGYNGQKYCGNVGREKIALSLKGK